jgi:hypothetical protein
MNTTHDASDLLRVQVFPLELTLVQQFIAIGPAIRASTTGIHVLGCSYPIT